MPERRHPRGLIDTSVAIDLPGESDLPLEVAVSAITLAELAAGPHATTDPAERAARQDRLQRIETTFEALPFDGASVHPEPERLQRTARRRGGGGSRDLTGSRYGKPRELMWAAVDSNHLPPRYQHGALPVELAARQQTPEPDQTTGV